MKKLTISIATLALMASPLLSNLANAQSFSDVSSGAWYAQTVNEMVDSGVGFGVDGSHYAPNQAITRGEVAQMIYNSLGKPAVSGASGFSDVTGSPYASAIAYCQQQGIIHGYPDGTFGPTKTITRQEAAVIIWNTFGNVDQNAKPLTKHFATQIQAKPWGNNPPLKDWQTFGNWAAFSINELALAGAIHGYPDGSFRPSGQITRAEMTQILDGVLHKVGYSFGVQPTQSANTLVKNSDGSQSPANVVIPKEDIGSAFTPSLQTEIKNLMSQVTFKTDGQNVTVTVPATNDPNVEWMSTDSNANQTHTQKETTIKSTNWVTLSLQQPDNVGSGVYLIVGYKLFNGQWTLLVG